MSLSNSKSQYYRTIQAQVRAELVEKSSRFIATASPASSREDAESFIKAISMEFEDATHNCFAYKIGMGDRALFRYSDDGEPSGTAGRPIFQAIETKYLCNVAIVVTRYFGGTKLGTGGLIRAYGGAALKALNCAREIRVIPTAKLELRFVYPLINSVHQVIEKYQAKILETSFNDKETLYIIELNAEDEFSLKEDVSDLTRGQIKITMIQEGNE